MVCLYNFLPRKKYFPRKVADKKEKLKFGWEMRPIMKPTCFAYANEYNSALTSRTLLIRNLYNNSIIR